MKAYDSYKDSGIQWLPKIPSHWDSSKIKSHFRLRSTKVSDQDYPALSVSKNGVTTQLETAVKTDNGDNRKLVKAGDFVVNSRSDRKGSCGVSSLDGSVSLINIVLEPIDGCAQYYHHLFRSNDYIEEFYRNGRGIVSDLWTTRWNEMSSIMIPFPPIEEQEKIVAYLDKQITLIESCKCQRERELQTLDELKRAEIASAVTRGLNPNVPMKDSGIPWIGQIPAHWTMMRIKNLLEESKVKSIDGHEQSLSLSKSAGVIPFDEKENRTMQSASLVGAKVVQCGDVVFNRFKARLFAISNYDGVVSPDYAVYKGKGRANLNYLVSLFGTEMYRAAFDRKASGIGDGFSRLYTADLFSMYAIFPPIEEQNEIVKYIALKTNQIDSMIDALKAEIDRLTEYKQRLISDVVTGQMNVQDEIA